MHFAAETYVLLTLVALLAGFVDSIAGGGGLLTVPAMLSFGVPPINTLATNKLQSMLGTSMACFRYARAGLMAWRLLWMQVIVVFICAMAGAWLINSMKSDVLAYLVPGLLVLVAAYVLFSPRMTDEDAVHRIGPAPYLPIAGGIGFYDGFFGPGTGTFFTATLVGLRGMGLTRATAHTKVLNLTSNVASLLLFAFAGRTLWLLGLCMAIGSVSGAWIGSHTAIRHGAKIIRPLLVVVSLALTARLIYQALS